MSNFNFVTDARLANGSYTSNNSANTATIDGWRPVVIRLNPGEEFSNRCSVGDVGKPIGFQRWKCGVGQVTDTIYYDKGQVTGRETVTQLGFTVVTQTYGPKGKLLSRTEVQTYDDGSRFEYKTEAGKNYIQAIDEDGKASGWKEYKTPAQEQATNAMYSDMAGFVNALRGKDKVNQLLYAAKIGINYQISQGNTNPSLQSLHNDVAALGAVVGVVAGLRAMRSGDTKTQIGGAVGLVSSANMLYSYASTGSVSGAGFLTAAEAGALELVGAAISISNLKHLDEMIDNGQYGSAMATLYGAYVGVTAIGSLAAGATLSSLATSAAAAGPVGSIVTMGAIALERTRPRCKTQARTTRACKVTVPRVVMWTATVNAK